MVSGSCLCGAVRFTVMGELPALQICHCRQCQKAQGGPFVAVIPITLSAFQLESGADYLQEFASSPDKFRVFCRQCGSPVFSRRGNLPNIVRLRVGLLNAPFTAQPGRQAHTAQCASWWPLDPEIPAFAGAAPADK